MRKGSGMVPARPAAGRERTTIPAFSSCSSVAASLDSGPMVAAILVAGRTCRSLSSCATRRRAISAPPKRERAARDGNDSGTSRMELMLLGAWKYSAPGPTMAVAVSVSRAVGWGLRAGLRGTDCDGRINWAGALSIEGERGDGCYFYSIVAPGVRRRGSCATSELLRKRPQGRPIPAGVCCCPLLLPPAVAWVACPVCQQAPPRPSPTAGLCPQATPPPPPPLHRHRHRRTRTLPLPLPLPLAPPVPALQSHCNSPISMAPRWSPSKPPARPTPPRLSPALTAAQTPLVRRAGLQR
jgi:hypothetical protein